MLKSLVSQVPIGRNPRGVTIHIPPENSSEPDSPDSSNEITDEHLDETLKGDDLFGVSSANLLQNTKPYLVVLSGKDQGKRFELVKQINHIGRNENADIVIVESQMSRNHGRLIVFPDRVFIEDHNSTNGTYVDGLRIDKVTLGPKSRIRIGDTVMKIDYKDPNEARFEDALYEAANTDALTGILNRRAFMTKISDEILLCRQNNLNLALVMCDADHFKRINDTYSHLAGDYVLRKFANLISEILRSEDHVGRYGGEEFIILLRSLSLESVLSCCERIRAGIESHRFEFQGQTIPCTLSMGICVRQGMNIPNLEMLIQTADEALLNAKKNGRNRIEVA